MEKHLVLVILNCYILTLDMIFFTAVEYWIEEFQKDLSLLQHFNKQFVLEGLSVILEFKYFCISGIYIHHVKGTAVRSKFAVLVVI